MTLRQKFFSIVAFIIAFIVFVVLMITWDRWKPTSTPATTPTETTPTSPVAPSPANPPSAPVAPLEKPATTPVSPTTSANIALETLTRSFAERFGSFSNESDFTNILELRSLMTPSMAAWADAYVADGRARATVGAPYYGLTTRALQVLVGSLDAKSTTATVTVATQRREARGDGTPRIFYQSLVLELQKISGDWKIHRAEWK